MSLIRWTAPVLALAALAACAPKGHWQEYAYPAQGFAVSFSVAPKTSTTSGVFVTEATNGVDDYLVAAVCAKDPTKNDDELLSEAEDTWRHQGTVKSETYVATGKIIGRELIVEKTGQPTGKVRLFIAKQCAYQVIAASHHGPDDPVVAHFLDSFRLLGG
ncbi:MAG: hypothetical protein ACHP7N_15670 [Caulobacterales bacterium]